MTFRKTEISILKALYTKQRPMSANEIAENSGIAWDTVINNMPRLKNKGLVLETKQNSRKFWSLNEEVLKDVR